MHTNINGKISLMIPDYVKQLVNFNPGKDFFVPSLIKLHHKKALHAKTN